MSRRLFVFFAACLAIAGVAQAAVPKRITKVPYVISKPGRYVLATSLVLKDTIELAAITISCDDVVLDLQDWKLELGDNAGSGSSPDDTTGIRAWSRQNVTIRNGTVRGFAKGIDVVGGEGNVLVEDILVDKCTFCGITMQATMASIVRRNRVVSVGGGTFSERFRIGIYLSGAGLKAIDNEIFGVRGPASSIYGILVDYSEHIVLRGNRVSSGDLSANQVVGINLREPEGVAVMDNFFSGWKIGLQISGGSDGIYRDNTQTRCSTAYSVSEGHVDGGGNK